MSKLTNERRKAIYRRDGYRCALCDSTQYLQIHHFIHRGQGGSNHPHNLICLCSKCHAQAHGYDVGYFELDANYPTFSDYMEQLITEYLADYYAPDWNPWLRDRG